MMMPHNFMYYLLFQHSSTTAGKLLELVKADILKSGGFVYLGGDKSNKGTVTRTGCIRFSKQVDFLNSTILTCRAVIGFMSDVQTIVGVCCNADLQICPGL